MELLLPPRGDPDIDSLPISVSQFGVFHFRLTNEVRSVARKLGTNPVGAHQ